MPSDGMPLYVTVQQDGGPDEGLFFLVGRGMASQERAPKCPGALRSLSNSQRKEY